MRDANRFAILYSMDLQSVMLIYNFLMFLFEPSEALQPFILIIILILPFTYSILCDELCEWNAAKFISQYLSFPLPA
jgi:hypothetical protein